MDGGLALNFFALMVSMTAVQSMITKGPVNALKKTGDSVTLECVMSSNNCEQVDWQKVEGEQSPRLIFRNSIGMLNSNSFPTDRYSVSRNGWCNLTITQLEISDSGRFICVQGVDDKEYTRSSILVVVSVAEPCLSDLVNKELVKGDKYSIQCAINVPAKALEPSNVALSFPNKTGDETETPKETASPTIKTTLNATVTKNGTMKHVCIASFDPSTQPGFDNTRGYLEVCSITQEIIRLSYPVVNISVSPPPPYRMGTNVTCTADGYPFPTFEWKNMSGHVVQTNSTLVIEGNDGDKYTCTAKNTVKGNVKSVYYVITVEPEPEPEPESGGSSSGRVAAIAVPILAAVVAAMAVGFYCQCKKDKGCPACYAALIVCVGGCVRCLTAACGLLKKKKDKYLEVPVTSSSVICPEISNDKSEESEEYAKPPRAEVVEIPELPLQEFRVRPDPNESSELQNATTQNTT